MKATAAITFLGVMMALIGPGIACAQMGAGPMGGKMPDDIAEMMQEQNKALAQAAVGYMTIFTNALYAQAKERPGRIDADFIKSAFTEMTRAYDMIAKYQMVHVKTMDPGMQARVSHMMERMNHNLAAVGENMAGLEKEVNGNRDLKIIAFFAGQILRHLDDMPQGPGKMAGPPMTPQRLP
jgi:hypothetical protein